MKKKFSFATLLERYALVLVFVLMVVVFTSIVPTFFSWNSLLNTLSAAAPMGIATIGMAIIILQGGACPYPPAPHGCHALPVPLLNWQPPWIFLHFPPQR